MSVNDSQIAELPAQLCERSRALNDKHVRSEGDFVLYWMHHAVRDHDNPALDTAITVGNSLDLPVLVYQGLGGNHRFNSDRHHTFIMEGARDVQRGLRERGIAYGFYLGRETDQKTPLTRLAARAALVVTEDFPAPPFTAWTKQLADKLTVPVWAVDSACIVPMKGVGRSFNRAFQFRDRIKRELGNRLRRKWQNVDPVPVPFSGELGFQSVDFDRADIAELCAECAINHAIGPVFHTPGGSTAGYERWERFKARGLHSYARTRNDASVTPPRGVSRLSPYLHHGHVSPFRIVREAADLRSAGSEKFLDEMLIWRELSYNFCFHHDDVEALTALPEWAQSTLAAHAGDDREALYDWESLARGRTGDVLWDMAQKSLLIHGELHNNVRMTWGKAILNWTRDPDAALRLLIDLNHRYALDGNDPNSYGGLLWCLGLFDRPFEPETAVLGTVRPRPTWQHARRLDMRRYAAKIHVPARSSALSIAVIGAGMSGLFAARTLMDHGHRVKVFDKARGVGGRMSWRRENGYAFDHGAQYFTARDFRFRDYVEAWVEQGIVKPWDGRIATARAGRLYPKQNSVQRYVGVPGMNAVAKHLASGLDVELQTRVAPVEYTGSQWCLTTDGGEGLGTYDVTLITAPPQQTQPLLSAAPHLVRAVQTVKLAPCWAVMAAFENPLEIPFDGLFIHDSPLSWAARDSGKPERSNSQCWVFHGSPDWSSVHLEDEPEVVVEALVDAFFKATGAEPTAPIFAKAHRWRYSIAENPLEDGCLWDPELKLGSCGDWCQGSRVEGAFLSGMAMAGRVLGLSDRR
jgi:photolyase PhrII